MTLPMPPICIAMAAAAGLIATVFLTGQTFGQRCERVYPNNPMSQELCVKRLIHGGDITDAE